MKAINSLAKLGEPIQWSVLVIVLLLALLSNSAEFVEFVKPYILTVGITLIVLVSIGTFLHSRQINLDSAKRKADFESMLERHNAMLRKVKK